MSSTVHSSSSLAYRSAELYRYSSNGSLCFKLMHCAQNKAWPSIKKILCIRACKDFHAMEEAATWEVLINCSRCLQGEIRNVGCIGQGKKCVPTRQKKG